MVVQVKELNCVAARVGGQVRVSAASTVGPRVPGRADQHRSPRRHASRRRGASRSRGARWKHGLVCSPRQEWMGSGPRKRPRFRWTAVPSRALPFLGSAVTSGRTARPNAPPMDLPPGPSRTPHPRGSRRNTGDLHGGGSPRQPTTLLECVRPPRRTGTRKGAAPPPPEVAVAAAVGRRIGAVAPPRCRRPRRGTAANPVPGSRSMDCYAIGGMRAHQRWWLPHHAAPR